MWAGSPRLSEAGGTPGSSASLRCGPCASTRVCTCALTAPSAMRGPQPAEAGLRRGPAGTLARPVCVCRRPGPSFSHQACSWLTSSSHFISQKKIPPASALISACHLMRPLLFIFLFVRRVGAVYVQPRQTQPPAGWGSPRLSPAGLPDWPCSGGPEVHAVDARKGYQETQTKTTCK